MIVPRYEYHSDLLHEWDIYSVNPENDEDWRKNASKLGTDGWKFVTISQPCNSCGNVDVLHKKELNLSADEQWKLLKEKYNFND